MNDTPDPDAITAEQWAKLLELAAKFARRLLDIEVYQRLYLDRIQERYDAEMKTIAATHARFLKEKPTDAARANHESTRERAEHSSRTVRAVETRMLTNHINRLIDNVYREIDAAEL